MEWSKWMPYEFINNNYMLCVCVIVKEKNKENEESENLGAPHSVKQVRQNTL